MTTASRYGNAVFGMMTPDTGISGRGHGNPGRQFQNRVPKWYMGSVDEFMEALARMDAGEMPRPTPTEMRRYDALILAASPDKEVENGESTID